VRVDGPSRFSRTAIKTAHARKLRRAATAVETRLWHRLRNAQIEGASFRRQHPAGQYVLDFYCPEIRLAIELDGGQHAQGRALQHDYQRDEWFADRGVITLRFWNSDITENLPGVLEMIAAKIIELRTGGMTPTRRWRADLPL
jgi:very-short-patch-repair endonuclease